MCSRLSNKVAAYVEMKKNLQRHERDLRAHTTVEKELNKYIDYKMGVVNENSAAVSEMRSSTFFGD